jgi:transcriptional regulator with XRE-family HTH domain
MTAIGHPGTVHRSELATFLRTRRERLRPGDVGLPNGGRRRVPGLRRQEVAQLADMSIDYYIRLEQARGPRPSGQVLSAIARALMLTTDEREYLFRIAGEHPPPATGPSREVTTGVRHLLDNLRVPAYVLDAKYEVLAWNRLAIPFIGDLDRVAPEERNIIRWLFRQPDNDPRWDDEQSIRFIEASLADLRAALARYPGDRGIQELVTELLATSPRFATMWAQHRVEVRRSTTKRLQHPQLGDLELECQVLYLQDSDQRLIVYTAQPGSRTDEAFRRLCALDRPDVARLPTARPVSHTCTRSNLDETAPAAI